MPHLPKLQEALTDLQPSRLDPGARPLASVAMVLSPAPRQTADLLLIQRTANDSDPWSGHLAFPGGRVDPEDPSRRAAAEREAAEEVGLDLTRGASLIGRLSDVGSAGMPIVVSAFVYRLHDPRPPLELEPGEVAAAHWIPVPELLNPGRRTRHDFTWKGQRMKLPAIDLLGPEAPVLWGLTYGFVREAFRLIGEPLP